METIIRVFAAFIGSFIGICLAFWALKFKDEQAREDILHTNKVLSALCKKIGIGHFGSGIKVENFIGDEKYEPWKDTLKDYVTCSHCGVLLKKDKAKKVQTLVDKEMFKTTTHNGLKIEYALNWNGKEPEKEIKTDYYCSLHAPKDKKK